MASHVRSPEESGSEGTPSKVGSFPLGGMPDPCRLAWAPSGRRMAVSSLVRLWSSGGVSPEVWCRRVQQNRSSSCFPSQLLHGLSGAVPLHCGTCSHVLSNCGLPIP